MWIFIKRMFGLGYRLNIGRAAEWADANPGSLDPIAVGYYECQQKLAIAEQRLAVAIDLIESISPAWLPEGIRQKRQDTIRKIRGEK